MSFPFRARRVRPRDLGLSGRAFAVLLSVLLFACGKGSDPSTSPGTETPAPRILTLCSTTMPEWKLVQMLSGNLVIVEGFKADGVSASEIITNLVASFVINTLDFFALDDWDARFSSGVYRIRNGGNDFEMRIIAREDFGDYQAGDTVKHNLFSPSSFVTGVKANLSGSVSYDRGPLFSLVSGSISWKNLEPRFRLDAGKISLSFVSTGLWRTPFWFLTRDSILSRMSTEIDLGSLKSDFKNGRLGFSYDSTRYTSRYLDIEQSVYDSWWQMSPLDSTGRRWSWEGNYRSRVDKTLIPGQPFRVYINGHASTVNGNRTGYYCDGAMTAADSIGFTVDDTSGTWGYFKSIHGDSIAYGYIPVGK